MDIFIVPVVFPAVISAFLQGDRPCSGEHHAFFKGCCMRGRLTDHPYRPEYSYSVLSRQKRTGTVHSFGTCLSRLLRSIPPTTSTTPAAPPQVIISSRKTALANMVTTGTAYT